MRGSAHEAAALLARQRDQRCSPPPSQADSWLRPRSRRCNDVCRRIIFSDIRAMPLATDVIGEQTLDIGKASEVAQKVAPSAGPAISSVTSAHDVTRLGSRPQPALHTFTLSLKI